MRNRIAVAFAALALASGIFLVVMSGWAQESPGRAKILGISYVKIRVTDMKKADAFYRDLLGLEPEPSRGANDAPAIFFVNSYQRVEFAKTDPGAKGSYLVEIGLATDSAMKMRAYLTAKGVPASKISTGADQVTSFSTQDPEGNKLVFEEQPKTAPSSINAQPIGNKILHAGFVVKDWRAESRFYEDILGFHLYWKGGFKDDGLDWYEIQVPDGVDWLEYMLNIPSNADHKELGVQNHFSLGVIDADAAASTLRSRGLKEFDGPEIGRDGKNSLDAYDPDQTRVEVMEFTPKGKPCCFEYTGPHPKP
jgi:catechol 2,3-dioxygenase-like lactoylglutathione lyase family enzyme